MRRLSEEMRFFRLELVNREASYNKVFGRQPKLASTGTTGTLSSASPARQSSPPSLPPVSNNNATASVPPRGGSAGSIASTTSGGGRDTSPLEGQQHPSAAVGAGNSHGVSASTISTAKAPPSAQQVSRPLSRNSSRDSALSDAPGRL